MSLEPHEGCRAGDDIGRRSWVMNGWFSVAPFAAALSLGACLAAGDDRPERAFALLGAEWVVEDIAGRGVIDGARATLVFGSDGRLSGDTSCNRYFADYRVEGTNLQIMSAGVTERACGPAVMDQERRFLEVFNAVDRYRIDEMGALVLSAPTGLTITARRTPGRAPETTYRCADGSVITATYPTTDTARLLYNGQSIDMAIARSGSGARYVGGGWQWWTKGLETGTISRLAPGEDIASAAGMTCEA